MTKASKDDMTLPEFERLLDVYGSDRSRWPVAARASAGQLVARLAAARRLLAEAECLDRVLERAPTPTLAREAALAERIVAAARRSPRMVAAGARSPAAVSPAADAASAGSPAAPLPVQGRWLTPMFGSAAGALAASLMLGVLIGLSSLSQSVLPAVEQMTGITLISASAGAPQVDLLDEDLL
jgi:hypothetical protein